MDHVVNHGENPCPVAGYQLVESVGLAGLAALHQVQFQHLGLSPSRFRFHIRRRDSLIHSTPKAFGAEATAPFTTIFSHERNNAVAHLEKSLLENGILSSCDQLFGK